MYTDFYVYLCSKLHPSMVKLGGTPLQCSWCMARIGAVLLDWFTAKRWTGLQEPSHVQRVIYWSLQMIEYHIEPIQYMSIV